MGKSGDGDRDWKEGSWDGMGRNVRCVRGEEGREEMRTDGEL